jgi:hypothetical protein
MRGQQIKPCEIQFPDRTTTSMTTEYSTLDVLRGASAVAVVLLTAILITILPAPGY